MGDQPIGLQQHAFGQRVDRGQPRCVARRRQRGLETRPRQRHGVEQVAVGRLRQALAERGQIGVDPLAGFGQQRARLAQTGCGHAQRVQRDDALRQHAQLPGAVHRLGVAGGGDQLLRHLPDAQVAVHRRGAQHTESLVFGDLARAHQDALGAIHQLALLEAMRHVGQRAAQLLIVREPRLRHLQHRAQPMHPVAVDLIRMHTGLQCTRHLDDIGVAGEHHQRPRRGGEQEGRAVEQRVVDHAFLDHDKVGREPHDVLHQIASLHCTNDVNTDRLEIGSERV